MNIVDIVTGWFRSLWTIVTANNINLAFLILACSAAALTVFYIIKRRRFKPSDTAVEQQLEDHKSVEEEVVETYMVADLVKVDIIKIGDKYRYLVEEPAITDEERAILEKIEKAYVMKGLEPYKQLEAYQLSDDRLKILRYYIHKQLRGGWKLEPLLQDDGLEDVTVTKPGPAYVIHRRHPDLGWIETNILFTPEELDVQARLLAERNGAELSIARPAAEIMSEQGDRIALTYAGELTPGTSTITIRKFPRQPYTIIDLIRKGALTPITAAYIWTMLENKKFLIVAGPTGSGKTTLLAAFLQLLPPNAKILTLEDYHPEINLVWHKNWHRFVTRRTLGETAYSLADILRLSLRHRPDYTVVGEVRGPEARVMFSAAATGHGMASTLHAESLEDVYQRLTGVAMGVAQEELAFLDVVALVKATTKGRKVVSVWEIEKPGAEHLISWFDEQSNRFFPETSRQLVVNSPLLVRNQAFRMQFETNLAIIQELLRNPETLSAAELSEKIKEMRKTMSHVYH